MARWTDIRDAVQGAIALASGLPPAQVIWAAQNVNAPALDYASLAITNSRRIGQDYLEQSYDASRALGQEIALVVRGIREIMLEVSVFTEATVPGTSPLGAGIPGMDALGRADLIATSLLLPSVRDKFTGVGITPFDPQPIQNIPSVVSAGFRGRASLPIRCYAPAQAIAEYFGWIASVSGTFTTTPPTTAWPYSST